MNNLRAIFEISMKEGYGEGFFKTEKLQEDLQCLCKQTKTGLFCQA